MLKNITGNIQKEQAIIPVLLPVLQTCQKYIHLLTDITGRTALPHVLNAKYCVKTNTTYTHKNTAVTITPCTSKVQTRHIYQNLYINYYAVIISLWAQINFSTNIWLRNHWNCQPNSNQFSTLIFQLQTWIILGWIVIEKLIFGWSLFQNQRFLNQIGPINVEDGWAKLRLSEAQRWIKVDSTLRSWSSVPTGITFRKTPRQTWWKTVLAALTKNIKILVRNNGSVDKGRRKMSVSNMIHVYIRS